MPASAPETGPAWPAAARTVARWLERGERLDLLLETQRSGLAGVERARAQQLVLGAVRQRGRIDAALGRLVPRPPRPQVRAVLLVAGAELVAGDTAHAAKIVHHAVGQAKALLSEAEVRMINAVMRRLAGGFAAQTAPPAGAGVAELAEFFSHPAWLVGRWRGQFGAEAARALLEWNQTPGVAHARWRAAGETPPAWLKPTPWPGFYEVPGGRWTDIEPLLAAGKIYLQDPSTRLAAELLAPQPGETVLDACAAPGGKALLIADALGRGRVVAMDLPGARLDRLRENLSRAPAGVETRLVEGDVRRADAEFFRGHGLPGKFAAVLLDAPCSNTGVMRHRADVKWRLEPGDFAQHARQQREMLAAAARLVAPGGRLVYSTCSIDAEENERVAEDFLAAEGRCFAPGPRAQVRPWENGGDGAGVFILRRK